jgi:transcription initiation factor TFIID subunit 10
LNTLQPGDGNLTAGSADRDIGLGGADPIDEAIDNEINMNNADGMSATNGMNDAGVPANPAALTSASAPASKKESSLRDFLGKMDDYAPIVRYFTSFSPYLANALASHYFKTLSQSRSSH